MTTKEITNRGLNLHSGGSIANRRKLDHYDTPSDVTIALLNFLNLPTFWTIWDPAAGNNAMVNVFEQYGHKTIATDIKTGTDYLTYPGRADAIITNPPFYCSAEFIEKARTESLLVAMLVKSQYWHSKSRYKLFMDHKPAYILPLTWRPDFRQSETSGHPTMEVLWTVWEVRHPEHTQYIPLTRPKILPYK